MGGIGKRKEGRKTEREGRRDRERMNEDDGKGTNH